MSDAAMSARRPMLLLAMCLAAGFVLRLYFLLRHPFLADDSLLYQDIALNWVHSHVYGLSTATGPRPTLIRLPGYPAVLAVCELIFGRWLHADVGSLRSFMPVLWLQMFADLGTCWVVAAIAGRMAGERARLIALALACLCPFTANYVAVPMTETWVLLTIAVAFYAAQRWLAQQRMRWVVLLAAALACSVMLRPDQGLLAVATVPLLLVGGGRRLQPAVLCVCLAALPFVPWTVRNLRTFGVVQPLAPKLANDPGEMPPVGFQRWFRTWGIDFAATQDAYWNYPEELVVAGDLPTRAFDLAALDGQTRTLLTQAGDAGKLDAVVDAGFAQMARERVAARPFRYYVMLPCARLVDMLLRPRVEMLPVSLRWWQWRTHMAETLWAGAYALLNLGYFLLAGFGLRRMRGPLVMAMVAFVLLRCALLLTLDNAEQRYTLEFFPVLVVFASAVWCKPAQKLDESLAKGL